MRNFKGILATTLLLLYCKKSAQKQIPPDDHWLFKNCFEEAIAGHKTEVHVNARPIFVVKSGQEQFYDVEYKVVHVGSKKTLAVTNNEAVKFEPFTIRGHIRTFIRYKEKTKKKIYLRVCRMYIALMPPMAAMSGGNVRIVPDNFPVEFSASGSVDMNEVLREGEMTYEWLCQAPKSPNAYCPASWRRVSTEVNFTMPASELIPTREMEIQLKVAVDIVGEGEALQSLRVVANAALLIINCVKNCIPLTDAPSFTEKTFLSVSCLTNCDGISEANYEWEVSNPLVKFDYDKDTETGRVGVKFRIKDKVLYDETTILVKIVNHDREGEAQMVSNYVASLTNIDYCFTTPKTGVAMSSQFTISCVQTKPHTVKGRCFMEVYLGEAEEGDLIVSLEKSDNGKRDVLLPNPGKQKFNVKVYDLKKAASHVLELDTTIESLDENHPTKQILKMMGDRYQHAFEGKSVNELFKSESIQDRENAIMAVQAVVNQLVEMDGDDPDVQKFIDEFKLKVIHDLTNAPVSSMDEILRVGRSITKLMSKNEPEESDPLLARVTSNICNKLGVKHLQRMKKELLPHKKGSTAKNVANALTDCVETNTNANFDVIKPEFLNVTTLAPNIDEPTITENYANYEDFGEEYYKIIACLEEVTSNILNTTAVVAKALAMTMAVGDIPIETITGKTRILVIKDQGYDIAAKMFQLGGSVVQGPIDFKGDEHSYDLFLMEWQKDIMWWNPKRVSVATAILNVAFWHSTCVDRVTVFKEPLEVVLNITHYRPETIINQTLTNDMLVQRITVDKSVTLRVKFYYLEPTDVFDVTFTVFKQPSVSDFQKNDSISVQNSYTQFVNTADHPVWCYLAIMPNKNAAAASKKVNYNFGISYQIAACVRWNGKATEWEFVCQSGSKDEKLNDSHIICLCKKFSALAGYLENTEALPQKPLSAEIALQLTSCYTVFWTVMSLVLFYCCLICLAALNRKVSFYFLADNRKRDRYAYLLLVKTGAQPGAGTTSNVTIKLVGQKSESLPHVLNYPDPELRILQRNNEDMFLMTTHGYLSDLKEVQLWYDCIGSSPSWTCKDISVYDMQSNNQWYFYVNDSLTIHPDVGDTIIVRTEPMTTEYKRVISFKKWELFGLYHTWRLSNHQENYSYVKRLTVLLSKVLMMFALVRVSQGFPTFTLIDQLDAHEKFKFNWEIVSMGLGNSGISFAVHVLISSLFRLSQVQFSKLKKQTVPICFVMTIILWVLLILLIVVSAGCLLIFGFWMPCLSGLVWLCACGVGLVFDIIIFENIFSIVMSCYSKRTMPKIRDKFVNIGEVTEKQRMYLYHVFSAAVLLRPYFKHLYKPLMPIQVKQRQIFAQIRRNIVTELEDLVMFAVYIIILYTVILFDRDPIMVYSKNSVTQLAGGWYTKTIEFESSVHSIENFYEFINETLIPSLQPATWYGNYVISDPGMTIDMNNKFLGVTRLRQHRLTSKACSEKVDAMKFLRIYCVPEFEWYLQDTTRHGQAWAKHPNVFRLDRLQSVWEYKTRGETETLSFSGTIARYPGGGYVALMGRTLYNSRANLRVLFDKDWLDNKTRAVFIEFLTYSVNSNIFNAVRLAMEKSATGYVFKTVRVDSTRLVYVRRELEEVVATMFILFIVWLVFLFMKQSIGFLKTIKTFYKNPWFYVDLAIISFSVTCIVLKFIRTSMLENYLGILKKAKHNIFVSYFSLFYFDEVLTITGAILICISTARLWKLLRFGLVFRILETTLKNVAMTLMCINIGLIVFLLAYGLCGHIAFGHEFKEFSQFGLIARTISTLMLQPEQIDEKEFIAQSGLSYPYFVSYFIMTQVVMFLFFCVITESYHNAKLEFSQIRATYNLKHYVFDKVRAIPLLLQFKLMRLRGGDSVTRPITPKGRIFRYGNVIMTLTNRINKMVLICKSSVRKKGIVRDTLSTREVDLMYLICHYFVFNKKGDKNALFFKARLKGDRLRFVDDQKLDQMLFVANAMMNENYKEKLKPKKFKKVKECAKIIKDNKWRLVKCEMETESLLDLWNRLDSSFERLAYLQPIFDKLDVV